MKYITTIEGQDFEIEVIDERHIRIGDRLLEVDFESVSGQKVDVEFGELTVPENRRSSQSRLIQLAFVRFKSTAKNPGSTNVATPPMCSLRSSPGG